MTTEHKALVTRLWNQIWIAGELDQLDQIVADPYVRHTRDGTMTSSPADYARHIASAVRTVKGTELIIDQIASIEDLVFTRLRLHGVNLDTGATVKITWLAHYRLHEGRIAEAWSMHETGLDW